MRRLINTKLFKLLEQSENESETGDLHFRLAYDEFVNRVSNLCTSRENPMANLFTLAYTRLELKSHQCRLSTQGAEKNALIADWLNKSLSMLDYALQWVDKPASGENKEFELLFIRTNIGFKKIATEAISHLEASGSYCEIRITDGSMMLVSIPLSEVVKMLSPDRFLRIHRGFSINLLHIDMLVGNTLIMVGGKKLPIGREHRKSVIGQCTLVGKKSRKYMP